MEPTADLLSEARFQFAVKCLQTVMQIKTSENVVFSPYSIYDGIFLLYLAFKKNIEKNLEHILQLHMNDCEIIPWHQKCKAEEIWITSNINDRKNRDRERSIGYYDVKSCWIKNLFDILLNIRILDRCEMINDIPNLMHRINEVLWNDIEGYIRQPVELNGLDENMIFIISSVLCYKGEIIIPDFLTHVPDTHHCLEKPKETVLSSTLGMFVTEIPIKIKTQSVFLLFPAVLSGIPNSWEVDQNISGLVERLTTKEGADELRKVLDKEEASTEKLSAGSVIYPDFFELENDLPVEELLRIIGVQIFEPDVASRPNFSPENLGFGARHRAYFKLTPENIIAGAVDMIFEKDHESINFKSIEETNCPEWKNSFVTLIYDRIKRTILFIGIINKNIEQPKVSKRRAQRYFVEQK